MWFYLGFASLVLLLIFWRSANAVWGGMTAGIIIGLIITIVSAISGNGFNWPTIIKGAIAGTLSGSFFEILGRISTRFKGQS